jgi:hypothetical protein
MARAVASDMESIFGPALRPMTVVVPRPEPEVLSRSRSWARLAAVGLLSVTAAAGVMTGKSVTATPAARPVAAEPARAPAPPAASIAAAPHIETSSAAVTEVPDDAAPTVTSPPEDAKRVLVAAPSQPPLATAYRPRVAAAQAIVSAVAPAAPTPATAPAPASAPVAYREPPAPAPTRIMVDCDRDPDACFAARLEWADRRTGEAFGNAAAAGVQPGILREYRAEWNRARGKADDRPGDALRIMAMITHDLKQLTNDPNMR